MTSGLFPVNLVVLLASLFSIKLAAETLEKSEEEEDWYQFEVIVFEHLRSDRHELRYEGVKYQALEDDAYLSIPQSRPMLVESFESSAAQALITLDESLLKEAFLALNRSSRSRVYSFQTWKQRLNRDDKPKAIRIQRSNKDNWQIEGSLQLRRERYIHADFSLSFYQVHAYPKLSITDWLTSEHYQGMDTRGFLLHSSVPYPQTPLPFYFDQLADESKSVFAEQELAESFDWLPLEVSVLNSSQRLRNGEIHYLDHPAFGVIITMEKVANPNAFGDEETNS